MSETAFFDYRSSHLVMLGSIARNNPSEGSVVVAVSQAIKHESYNSGAFLNDIAVLKFAANVTLNGRLFVIPNYLASNN